MKIIKIDPVQPECAAVEEIVGILKQGGVIAYPTETFYGIGADAANASAVKRVFEIKGRDFNNPIPLIIGTTGDVSLVAAEIPETALILMDFFWPGPLTLVLKASEKVLLELTAGTGKIGVRVPGSAVAREMSYMLKNPITATSANISGNPECSSAEEVMSAIGDRLDAIVDGGRTPGRAGSTLLDVTVDPPAVLREGAVSAHVIRCTLGKT
ncbi:MAG: L-threonylcarbamoyladenylate synthase [Syntrophales bacterium]|nr:L-threonylcarbamoyladenylate synthase [Syntrophales bacterium]